MNDKLTFGPGHMAVVQLRIELEDGSIVEDTRNSDPVCLTHGDGTLLDRLEQLIVGLAANDRRAWELKPEEAFGLSDPENIRRLPRNQFPETVEVVPGNIIAFAMPDGNELPGMVLGETDDGHVEIDFNHPLAGRTLSFEVEVLSVAVAE